jgi:dipeptidyl aminopeptidase/acylaminoacyl peptidase
VTVAGDEAQIWQFDGKKPLRSFNHGGRVAQVAFSPDGRRLITRSDDVSSEDHPAANEVFGAWREGQHDDLILAVANGVWQAERRLEVWVL